MQQPSTARPRSHKTPVRPERSIDPTGDTPLQREQDHGPRPPAAVHGSGCIGKQAWPRRHTELGRVLYASTSVSYECVRRRLIPALLPSLPPGVAQIAKRMSSTCRAALTARHVATGHVTLSADHASARPHHVISEACLPLLCLPVSTAVSRLASVGQHDLHPCDLRQHMLEVCFRLGVVRLQVPRL